MIEIPERVPRVLVMLLLLVGVSSIPAPAGDPTANLVSAGATPDLILVYTGDVIGYIDPCG
jgi:hypothetical protein